MKAADKIIRAQRLVPEVYSDQSRDFQLFTKLADAVYNSCYFNTESIKYVTDPKNINSKLLSLLADKFGINKVDAETLTDDEIRYILRCLPYLIQYKGSLAAINALVNMYFKIYHISGTYRIDIANESTIVQGITLADHTILLGLEMAARSTTMLYIMAKYLLPPGYSFFIYFYTNLTKMDKIVLQDELTLLYRSSVQNSEINQEIPDFIAYNTALYTTQLVFVGDGHTTEFVLPASTIAINNILVGGMVIVDYDYIENTKTLVLKSPPEKNISIEVNISYHDKSKQTIGAVDAVRLSSIYENHNNNFFIGFCTNSDLKLIKQNYDMAQPYDPDRDPLVKRSTEQLITYQKTKQTYNIDLKEKHIHIFEISICQLKEKTETFLTTTSYDFNPAKLTITFKEPLKDKTKLKIKIYYRQAINNPYKNFEVAKFNDTTKKIFITHQVNKNRYQQLQSYDQNEVNLIKTGDGVTNIFKLPENTLDILGVKLNGTYIHEEVDYKYTASTQTITFTKVPAYMVVIEIYILLDKQASYTASDTKIYKDLTDKYSKYLLVNTDNTTNDPYAYASWKDMKPNTLIISDDTSIVSKDTMTIKTAGDVYYWDTDLTWHKLKFKYNVTELPGIDIGEDYDVCCVFTRKTPYLYRTDSSPNEQPVKYKGMTDVLPTSAAAYDLYYKTTDYKYYVYLTTTIQDTLLLSKTNLTYTSDQCPIGFNLMQYCKSKDAIIEVLINGEKSLDYAFNTNTFILSLNDPEKYKTLESLELHFNTNWLKCKEGPILSDQYSDYSLETNTIIWKRGGTYYIKNNNKWNQYNYPLYFTKLVQMGVK